MLPLLLVIVMALLYCVPSGPAVPESCTTAAAPEPETVVEVKVPWLKSVSVSLVMEDVVVAKMLGIR